MAWVNRRRVEDGGWRYTAVFRDPAGSQRSAGTRVKETTVEVSRKDSPTEQRYTVKAYPKDDEPRVLRISTGLAALLDGRIIRLGLGPGDLLFPSTERNARQPMSRNTFRTRVWRPAVARAGLDGGVRMLRPSPRARLVAI